MHYSQPQPQFVTQFFELIAQAKRVVITGHVSPDDDSISSVLALYEIIAQKKLNKNVHIIYTAQPDDRFSSFKHYDKIQFVDDIASAVQPTDTLVVCDGSQLYRFSSRPEVLKKLAATICIDHHASPTDDFTLSMVAPAFPANADLIYQLFKNEVTIDTSFAEIFLLGILGDTGNLTYIQPSQTGTLASVKELVEAGNINIQELKARYDQILPREFAVLQELIKNTQYGSAPGWPDFQYSLLTREFIQRGNYTEQECSSASSIYKSHYVRRVAGYPWGFVARPGENGDAYASLRSLPGSVNVRDLMQRMQLGGGHDRAAGGTFKKQGVDIDGPQAVEAIIAWLGQNKPALS